jgi:hypothetical protein
MHVLVWSCDPTNATQLFILYVRTTERDEAGVSPVDLSPRSGELNQLLGLLEAGQGGREERGERERVGRGRGDLRKPVHDIIWLLGMSILGEYIHTHRRWIAN